MGDDIIHNPSEIEVAYKLGDGGRLRAAPSQIVTPDQADMAAYARANATTCGMCKYFALSEGQKRMESQRLVERVVREEGWKKHHLLVSPQNEMGICGAHESGERGGTSMLTGTMHVSCPQYVPSNKGVSSARRGA